MTSSHPPTNMDDALRSAEFLSAIIEHVAHPIFVKDREFRFVLLNRALGEMTGFPREQMLGKTDYDFFPREEADFFRQQDTELFRTGSGVTIEEETITDRAGARHVLATTKVPIRDASGQVTHLAGIIHDITRLKAAEEVLRSSNEQLELRIAERTLALAAAQAELLRKERLAVLGQLTGGLAHQIRNPLGAIANATAILKKSLGPSPTPDARQALEVLREEVWRANRIMTDLLEYARVRPAIRRAVAVQEVVELALANQEQPRHVEVSTQLPDLPPVLIDPDQVEGALGNLVRNAFEAMPDGGTLTITAERAGAEVVVSLTDTGPGIAPELAGRLFEPLVTTKPLGFGLGLPTAKILIENQGGAIRLASRAVAGTRFDVHLPLADGPAIRP